MIKIPLDDKTGYTVPSYQKIVDMVKGFYYNKFGQDIDLDDDTVAGGIAQIQSQIQLLIENLGLSLHNANFLLKSVGQDIDDYGADLRIYRKPANNAYVQLLITCYVDSDSPTVINADDGEFSTADGQIFQITNDVTIAKQSNDSNGNPLSDDDGNPLGTATVQAVSEQTGSNQNVLANTIINSEQSIDGLYSVTNPNGATGGSEKETDQALKYRIFNYRLYKTDNSVNGLENAIKSIESVKDARIVNNNEMSTDKDGNPPKSIHIYVVGGDDSEIAQTIQNHILTDKTVGNVSATAYDVSGKPILINFDRAKTISIYLNINLKINNDTFNHDDGVDTIKQNIINYFSDFSMGQMVDFTKLFAPIYSVNGITGVSLSLSRDGQNFSPNVNIDVDSYELPVIDSTNITINVN
ncbi:hypothetical protein DY120_07420 [Apilactobacillus micheneri]|uniref:Baseplate protein J-like domain-containing protein n=1 Tax=Apilactobacillus micheneri TaxID=1899430 RepID=A0ABY2YV62_9LACO|nr:baseplate J/gp47 family protein [Apilactobacillus micheneri]TPR23127.1 hypothetical protein DY114_07405 [Apilactobacillus micheneri]TPR24445.1 hypothetical protein DY111_07420 [Apilactobacillus micheneri]TPR29392.1 hypothetical protein DY120_07420 [Apilactobacillus micheneri]TPR34599.1 hypothetical protein DY027_07410 [Apilactobacillus micheneri]